MRAVLEEVGAPLRMSSTARKRRSLSGAAPARLELAVATCIAPRIGHRRCVSRAQKARACRWKRRGRRVCSCAAACLRSRRSTRPQQLAGGQRRVCAAADAGVIGASLGTDAWERESTTQEWAERGQRSSREGKIWPESPQQEARGAGGGRSTVDEQEAASPSSPPPSPASPRLETLLRAPCSTVSLSPRISANRLGAPCPSPRVESSRPLAQPRPTLPRCLDRSCPPGWGTAGRVRRAPSSRLTSCDLPQPRTRAPLAFHTRPSARSSPTRRAPLFPPPSPVPLSPRASVPGSLCH